MDVLSTYSGLIILVGFWKAVNQRQSCQMGNVKVLNQRLEMKSIEENYYDTNCLATCLRTICINNTRCILQPAMFHRHAIWENEALNTSTVRLSHILHPGGLLRNQCSHVMKEWLILHPAEEGKIRCNIHCVSGVTASQLFVLTVKFTAKNGITN